MRRLLVQNLMVYCSLGDTNGVGFLLDLCEEKYNHIKAIFSTVKQYYYRDWGKKAWEISQTVEQRCNILKIA